jgi:hypothetical protein
MKTRIARILTPLVLIVLSTAGPALAQYQARVAHVNVPFDFSIGDKTFAAGNYSIVRTAPDQLDLRDSHGRVLTSFITHSVQTRDVWTLARLEFSTAAGGHALWQVWLEGDSFGNELPAPKAAAVVASGKPDGGSSGGNK